ncbi:bifunctional UDP-N-acetylmuramoyl-tripeptide:D-alanyl-D-alanine ligase/alanine racemase [Parachlamydia sp. AcF125]|uniref:bifunctional UDP-N-acetylmuramoyl-tripeptide:D-alanyl-D-alanine ligase/alanine racemase n=1 Tax=Parachlamydia sp. AcF125 TaxID=2795736 RepID=UPI001BC92D04|nr:bifunctional UDP-N-acetylmuramoyl-tripeptide:D-alanyl-D-alanine ligase/alanine racemase [Parachlamydia sp. AcF125]MBS4167506.1 Alanine racemase 2 [Parachlamydia sp. AcF125]
MESFDLRSCPFFQQAGGDLSSPAIIEHVSIDSRRVFSPHTLFVALKGQTHDGHAFIAEAAKAGARYALVRQGWRSSDPIPNMTLLRVDNPLKAFQSIAKAYRQQRKHCKVVAIGGSHGKTMLKDLLETMLAKQYRVVASPESFNSQIGVPLSLFKIKDTHEIALIEAAFSQPGEMEILSNIINPEHVILTAIGAKHLHTLGSLELTAQETMKLLSSLKESSWALIPSTPLLKPYLTDYKAQFLYWSQADSTLPYAAPCADLSQMAVPYAVHFPDQHLFKGEMTKGFSYFLDLINIACKSAWLFQVSSQAISEALHSHQLEPMRTEIWKSPTGTVFINEPYSSDPQSIDQALARLHYLASNEKKTLIFGGLKGISEQREHEYRRIGLAITHHLIHHLILIGSSLEFQPLVQKLNPSTTLSFYPTITQALHHLRKAEEPNQVVLIKGSQKISLDFLTETYHDSICTNQSVINLATIEFNLKLIQQRLPPHTRLMVMVKALAYGTEDIQIAKFLKACQIDILGVSYVDEGIALKRAGVKQAIFALSATPYEITKILKWGIEIGASDQTFIQALAKEASAQKKEIKVHLHIDTGMGRFGCRPEKALILAQMIHASPFLKLEGAMTHFACAEDPKQDAFTCQQIKRFDETLADIEAHGIPIPWKHAANSSAALRFNLPQYNMVRIGLATYGLFPSAAVHDSLNLKLALSLLSRIVGINLCKQGETISYGRNYTVEKPLQRIGVLPIGYFDGLHRHYSGKGWVLVHGQKAPMVGNICMDFMMIDITDIPTAQVGDTVLIFGEDEHGHYLSPEEFANQGNSIVHELVTCIGPRIPRIFIYEES